MAFVSLALKPILLIVLKKVQDFQLSHTIPIMKQWCKIQHINTLNYKSQHNLFVTFMNCNYFYSNRSDLCLGELHALF